MNEVQVFEGEGVDPYAPIVKPDGFLYSLATLDVVDDTTTGPAHRQASKVKITAVGDYYEMDVEMVDDGKTTLMGFLQGKNNLARLPTSGVPRYKFNLTIEMSGQQTRKALGCFVKEIKTLSDMNGKSSLRFHLLIDRIINA